MSEQKLKLYSISEATNIVILADILQILLINTIPHVSLIKVQGCEWAEVKMVFH